MLLQFCLDREGPVTMCTRLAHMELVVDRVQLFWGRAAFREKFKSSAPTPGRRPEPNDTLLECKGPLISRNAFIAKLQSGGFRNRRKIVEAKLKLSNFQKPQNPKVGP